MYHLLVSYNGWEPSRDTLSIGRVFEYTHDDLIQQFKPGGNLDISEISSYPALFATETGGSGQQFARVGYVNRIVSNAREVQIEYSIETDIPPLSNSTLEQLAPQLQIDGFELSRTHWSVKDIDLYKILLRHQISSGLSPSVFSFDDAPVVEDLISVMMPFNSDFDNVYETLRNTAENIRLNCLRADDIWEHDAVIQDVVSLICRSKVVVCDCTGRNANVFYEAGIAHSLGKDVILITQSHDDIPFDLRHLRYIHYLDNDEGRQDLSTKLSRRINTILT